MSTAGRRAIAGSRVSSRPNWIGWRHFSDFSARASTNPDPESLIPNPFPDPGHRVRLRGVTLTLEVTSPPQAKLTETRHSFGRDGGSIGREIDNSWVLPHSKVSGHHALISYRDSVFYIEDTSRNGVFLNSSRNRLVRGQAYPLGDGDRLIIDPYEIRVSIAGDRVEVPR